MSKFQIVNTNHRLKELSIRKKLEVRESSKSLNLELVIRTSRDSKILMMGYRLINLKAKKPHMKKNTTIRKLTITR